MRVLLLILLTINTFGLFSQSQKISPSFEKEIESYLNHSVKTIQVDSLNKKMDDFIILDAREKPEYDVSRIPGAVYVGYNHFRRSRLKDLDRTKEVVVYCSIGYRSEKIGEILEEEGFKEVFNLYGSIFAWANAGYSLEDREGKKTQKIHTYNKSWSQWVVNKSLEKIW